MESVFITFKNENICDCLETLDVKIKTEKKKCIASNKQLSRRKYYSTIFIILYCNCRSLYRHRENLNKEKYSYM